MERRAVKVDEPDQPLHIKYRPRDLADMIGQEAVVKALRSTLDGKAMPHTFLFTGPSGCGKTTLARIVARHLKIDPFNIIETDAATNNGIDDMRALIDGLQYQAFGSNPNKLIILDECHALSKQAWQSLLKTVEEPQPHVYFAFCTTDAGKVPDTIKTRSATYNLKSCSFDDLMDLLDDVVDSENLDPAKGVLELVAKEAKGSPRQALVMLSVVHACDDREAAATLLESAQENAEVIDLARLLMDRSLTFAKVQATLQRVAESTSPESVRIVIVNYLAAVCMKAKDKDVGRLLDCIAAFSKPMNPSDKWAPILLAFGDVLL